MDFKKLFSFPKRLRLKKEKVKVWFLIVMRVHHLSILEIALKKSRNLF
jgi:hypothetical protein